MWVQISLSFLNVVSTNSSGSLITNIDVFCLPCGAWQVAGSSEAISLKKQDACYQPEAKLLRGVRLNRSRNNQNSGLKDAKTLRVAEANHRHDFGWHVFPRQHHTQ